MYREYLFDLDELYIVDVHYPNRIIGIGPGEGTYTLFLTDDEFLFFSMVCPSLRVSTTMSYDCLIQRRVECGIRPDPSRT